MRDAQQQGSRIVDDEISELLAELDIEPGKPVAEESVNAIHGWATIEDDDEVVEALRLDTVDDMAALLSGTHVSTGGEEEEEEEGGGDENTGRERRVPPAYDELSSHFSALVAAAEESGNRDAAFYLTKAKMAIIAAHSAKRVRQADMSLSRRSEGGGCSTCLFVFLGCASCRACLGFVCCIFFFLLHRSGCARQT